MRLFVIILRFQPDVINLHYLGSPGLFLWLLHFLSRFRLVVSLHGGDVDGEPYQSRFNRWLFRSVLARAQRVTACSQALLEQVLVLSPNIAPKARVIHNGVDVDLFTTARPHERARPYLLAVGQLERHKGFDVLVSAFGKLADRFPHIDLLIAGEGSQFSALQDQIREERVKERILLLGAANREEVASLMQGCLAVVIPSRREPFGIVGLEAMASGKPIVATQVGGLTEALDGGQVVWVPEADSVGLACGIVDVLEDPGSSTTVEANRLRAAERSWRAVAKGYLDVFAGTVPERSVPRAGLMG